MEKTEIVDKLGVIRKATEYSGHYAIGFYRRSTGLTYSINELVRKVSEITKIPYSELYNTIEDNIKRFKEKHKTTFTWEEEPTYLIFTIYKKDKESSMLKEEIKMITEDTAKLINTIIDAAITIRNKQNIKNWIWKTAELHSDGKKLKFKPTETDMQ